MAGLALPWLEFAACLVAIGTAGPVLCRYGDAIGARTGLSGSWIGLVLIAVVTSIPELATGASAVTLTGSVDIAVGDVLGSCVFNLSILAVLDFALRGESVYRRVGIGHVLAAGFGVVLIGIAGLNILLRNNGLVAAIGHVGLYVPLILLLYLVGMRTITRYESLATVQAELPGVDRHPGVSLRTALLRYGAAAAVVAGAGIWLPFVADHLADAMGWRSSFVGALLVAAITSIPELVVTLAAVRIGAYDMAFANVLGSNMFNMVVLAIDDVLYLPGPILAHASPELAVSAMSAAVMSGLVIIGLVYRPAGRVFHLIGWTSFALIAMYVLNAYAMFLHG